MRKDHQQDRNRPQAIKGRDAVKGGVGMKNILKINSFLRLFYKG